MEGRRVSRQNKKYNPLFVLFLCLVAASIILLIVSAVLGFRLRSANKKLKAAEEEVAELTATVSQLQEDLIASQNRTSSQAGTGDENSGDSSGYANGETISADGGNSWLDLSGHQEVKVEPSNLLSGYTDYYTTASVNLRGGPATSYDRITTLDYGTKVQAAAKEGNWTFVKAGSRFGWINSDYLSSSAPAAHLPMKPESSR